MKVNTQPDKLPLLERKDMITEKGAVKLNPFMWQGQKLRVVGYCLEQGHSIKNETTGEYKWKSHSWLISVLKHK